MSLPLQTTADINNAIISSLESSFSQTVPLLPKSFIRVLSKVLAGVFILLYKYGGFIFLQLFVKTASDKATIVNGVTLTPLTEWGRLVGVGDPTAATQAVLLVTVTIETPGGTLPGGTQLIKSSTGVTYITTTSVVLTGASVNIDIRAVADQAGGNGAGVLGNLEPGDTLSFANPLGDVARTVTVVSQTVTAANAEATDVYRQRVLDRFQKRPQGGAYADYEIWGEEVEGIINCYPYTGDPGQVNVYSEATVASSGSPDGIPTAAQLLAVKNSIEQDSSGLASRRPAGAFVNSLAITRVGFDVEVIGITGVADLSQVQADITTTVTAYMLEKEPFIPGLSVLPRKDRITRNQIISIVDDIVNLDGGSFTGVELSLTVGGGLIQEYVLGEGEKAKATQVTYS